MNSTIAMPRQTAARALFDRITDRLLSDGKGELLLRPLFKVAFGAVSVDPTYWPFLTVQEHEQLMALSPEEASALIHVGLLAGNGDEYACAA